MSRLSSGARLLLLPLLACLLLATPAIVTRTSAQSNSTCPEGHFCYADPIAASDSVPCSLSQYCPGGQSATLCERGHFCPTTTEQIECPEGYYCPTGSVVPVECSPFSACPAGSYRQLNVGCLVLLALLLPVLLFLPQLQSKLTRASTPYALKDAGRGLPSTKSSGAIPPPVPLSIAFRDLTASVSVSGTRLRILDGLSGSFPAGSLTAILGPSGGGKSSFLSVLLGTVTPDSGALELTLGGETLKPSDMSEARLKGVIAFVPQSDILLAELTPRDMLLHSARTRLPAHWSARRRERRVDDTLRRLGLWHVRDVPCGDVDTRGLSGGERKRASIGIELVTCPSLLVLDEPTSGLDATSAQQLVQTLKMLHGTSVLAVLHQPRPECVALFDTLMLLAPGGRTVYCAAAAGAQDYFDAVGYACPRDETFADYALDVITGNAGAPQLPPVPSEAEAQSLDSSASSLLRASPLGSAAPTPSVVQRYLVSEWASRSEGVRHEHAQRYPAHQLPPPVLVDEPNSPADDKDAAVASASAALSVSLPSWWWLSCLYTWRGLLQLWRNARVVRQELLLHLIAGAVLGMAFAHNNAFVPPLPRQFVPYCPREFEAECNSVSQRPVGEAQDFYTVMCVGLLFAVLGTRAFGSERANLKREANAGLSMSAYVVGKSLADVPFMLLGSFLYCMAYFLVAAPVASFTKFYALLVVYEFAVFGVGYVSSLLFWDRDNVLLCAGVSALLGGLATDAGFPSDLCWARWLAEGLWLLQARRGDFGGAGSDTEVRVEQFLYTRSEEETDAQPGFKLDMYDDDCGALIIFGLVLRALTRCLALSVGEKISKAVTNWRWQRQQQQQHMQSAHDAPIKAPVRVAHDNTEHA